MLIAIKSIQDIKKAKEMLAAEFDMKDLGEAKVILDMEIENNRSTSTARGFIKEPI